MRMVHYFAVAAIVVVPLLLATVLSGIFADGSTRHLSIGLLGALAAVGAQTLLILFMIITGRVLRSAMEARPLAPEFLAEANEFFARKSAYPVAVLAALAVVAAAVLGYGERGFGAPAAVHMLVGLAAVAFNLAALPLGYRALRENQRLLDRVAAELDRLDAQPDAPPPPPADELDPAGAARRWALAGAAAWLPYLYWVFIEWRGDFGAVGPLVPIGSALASAYAFTCAWLSRRAAQRSGA